MTQPLAPESGRALAADAAPAAAAPSVAAPVAPIVDVLMAGTVFFDLVFSGLPGMPEPGHEIRSAGLGSSPGGAANLAIAVARLGLRVRLVTILSDDMYGAYLVRTLEAEGVDLSKAIRKPGWRTPLTVSLAFADDRSMITHECPVAASIQDILRAGGLPARAAMVYLGAEQPTWLEQVRATGTTVFADVGWDETGRWDPNDLARLDSCDVFLPNCVEAMAYTRTDSPEAAALALAGRVPLVVVKCGGDGAVAVRGGSGEVVRAPAIPVTVVDTTGAGDVFDAGFVFGHLSGWSLVDCLRFANLSAGLSVTKHGGSLSAPGWSEVGNWLREHREVAPEYRFIGGRVSTADTDRE